MDANADVDLRMELVVVKQLVEVEVAMWPIPHLLVTQVTPPSVNEVVLTTNLSDQFVDVLKLQQGKGRGLLVK